MPRPTDHWDVAALAVFTLATAALILAVCAALWMVV